MNIQEPFLEEVKPEIDFARRHIGCDGHDRQSMLRQIGFASEAEFIDAVAPRGSFPGDSAVLGGGCSEADALARLRGIAEKNKRFTSYIGMGYYGCYMPSVILRNLLENPAWYTAYTPYQAEISQGRLEALLNFQTMVADLTGMDIANASLLDEATAAAEAMAFCQRLARNKSKAFFVSADCYPQTIDVVRTRAEPLGIRLIVGDEHRDLDRAEFFGALLQYPNARGEICDYTDRIAVVHQKGALAIVAADLLSLTLLASPAELGADVVVGTTQRFGTPLGFGGPHAAYFATRDEYKRAIPGRLVGVSIDNRGRAAYRLALQTREQHIRREKATSNICTAQVLPAVIAAMYAVYHGPDGLAEIARRIHRLTVTLAAGLERAGYEVLTQAFFDTLLIRTGSETSSIHSAARERSINLRHVDGEIVGISLDETTAHHDVEELLSVFASCATGDHRIADKCFSVQSRIPVALARSTPFLTHPVFNSYHTETEMLRYLRRLADKDLALDRTMIPLGSCTMKLTAASEIIPISWPQFSGIHPFAPADQTQGYRQLTDELQAMLCACTGYDAVSLQPNAGSQGELAGLLAIRAYHSSRNDAGRDICLIPASAHGTNPASAQMAGMQVLVVQCDADGNVDLRDLESKAAQHASRLAALMVTYPSTHGVFEEGIEAACRIVHQNGGQVYIDGANLNALVGLRALADFGGDVSHINLHKTFCIPHGGGGPGVGAIGVKSHLEQFLPGHRFGNSAGIGPVAAAPYGSANVFPITWMYVTLMGAGGLRDATVAALLNANYVAHRLSPHYPILYTGARGLVAHECIVDLRQIKERTGITAEDVAKRLIDYGFHAPTVSFPVPDTLMIEPTESEAKQELDRFCAAMIRIREEIDRIASGAADSADNVLKNAPHTAMELVDAWHHPYSREEAVYPVASLRSQKYWPPVGRVNNVYGDRNVVCRCPVAKDDEHVDGRAS